MNTCLALCWLLSISGNPSKDQQRMHLILFDQTLNFLSLLHYCQRQQVTLQLSLEIDVLFNQMRWCKDCREWSHLKILNIMTKWKKGIKKGMKKCKCKPHQEVKTKDDIKFSSLSFQWKMPSLDDAFIAVGQHVLHLHLFTSRVLLFLSTHFPWEYMMPCSESQSDRETGGIRLVTSIARLQSRCLSHLSHLFLTCVVILSPWCSFFLDVVGWPLIRWHSLDQCQL